MPDFEDKIPISEFSYTNTLHNTDQAPIIQQDGADWDNFRTSMADIGLHINKEMEYVTELHTTSKKIIGAINELADGGGSVDITTEIDTPSAIQTFSDGGDNIPMKSCEVAIVAQQASGTPSPSNPLPITGFSSVIVKDTGVNLAPSNLYNGIVYATGLWDYVANRVTNYNGKDTVTSMPYLQAGTYTINISGLNVCTLLTKDSSGNILDSFAGQWNNLPFTFTLTQAGYLFYTGRKSDNSNLTPTDHTPKVVSGSSIDMSEITTTPVSLGQTIYGGTAELVSGNGSKTWGEVDLSTLTYTQQTIGGVVVSVTTDITDALLPSSNQDAFEGISEQYETIRLTAVTTNKIALGTNGVLYVGSTSPTGKLIYKLATPTVFTFTGATIPTLSGVNNVYADSGDVNELEYFNENADEIASMVRLMTRT